MSGQFRIIKEVPTTSGSPGATSEYSSSYTKDKAFKSNDKLGWSSKNGFGELPDIVWYHFRRGFSLAEVTFRSNGKLFFIIKKIWQATLEQRCMDVETTSKPKTDFVKTLLYDKCNTLWYTRRVQTGDVENSNTLFHFLFSILCHRLYWIFTF